MTESRQGTSVKPDPDVANPVSGQADDLVARRTGMVSLSPRHISAPQLARRMCVERTQGRYIASAEQLSQSRPGSRGIGQFLLVDWPYLLS